jgi:hypothetical protein
MKQVFSCILSIVLLATTAVSGQLKGAWQTQLGDTRTVMIASEAYLSLAFYEKNTYQSTWGGTYQIEGNTLVIQVEFDDKNPQQVGTSQRMAVQLTPQTMNLAMPNNQTWTRIDDASAAVSLAGNWRITARANAEGTMLPMKKGPRKTLKICSGTRFQWIAINTETKEFFGTGGGSYTLDKGRYTETIEFFSRDNTRVGASLGFNAELSGNQWISSGKSSKGDPIRELWEKE